MNAAPDIRIREANPRDCEVIARFNIALASETENIILDPLIVHDGVQTLLSDRRKGVYFVAESAGAVIGQVMITYEWSDWRNGTFWWLQSVYVQKEFRRRGVFKTLLAHVQEQSRRQPNVCGIRLYMDADNETARQAYQRLGLGPTNYVVLGDKD